MFSSRDRTFGVLVLRSINALTGALVVGAASAAFVLGAVWAETVIGRPGSAIGFVIALELPFMGVLGSVVGALVGWVTHRVVSHTSFRGSVNHKMVLRGLILAVVVAAACGAYRVRRFESYNQPRVMQSDGRIKWLAASKLSAALTPAVVLYSLISDTVTALDWNGSTIEASFEEQTLILRRNTAEVDRVSVAGLDYVTEVVGTTATLAGGNREWLAVIVRLRATGRRELLLIYDPDGTRSHQELLARTKAGPVLWTDGERGDRQEIILTVGEPLRYFVH